MRQNVHILWILSSAAALAGCVAAASLFFLGWRDDSGETPASTQVSPGLNYECRDEAARAALRAIPRGVGGVEWIGNVGIYLPFDAVGHDVIVLGSWKNGAVKMAVVVREGVEFQAITMDGVEMRTGERISFHYGGTNYAQGPVTYGRPDPSRPFYGAFQVPTLGVYRLSYALDGIDQGSAVLALCRTEWPFDR